MCGVKKPGWPSVIVMYELVEIARLAIDVAVRRVVPDLAAGDAVPENLQAFEPALRRVAGDDRRIDRADRDAANPVRLDMGLVQRLIDAGLIGAERAAALQHQRDAVAALRPPAARMDGLFEMWASRIHIHLLQNCPTIPRAGDAMMTSASIGFCRLAFCPRLKHWRVRKMEVEICGHDAEGNPSHPCQFRPLAIGRTISAGGIAMRREDLLKFPSMPAAGPSYPAGPYRFVNREFLVITYETDPELIRAACPSRWSRSISRSCTMNGSRCRTAPASAATPNPGW